MLCSFTKREEMSLTDLQKKLIERIGVALERSGLRPAPARIIGLLFVADSAELTFEEIAEALKLSKSAISNALNTLQQSKRLEYITRPGDRRRFFRLNVTNWEESFMEQLEEMTDFNLLLQQVLEARTADTLQYNSKINELCSFMGYVSQRLPQMLQEWKKQKFLLAN